MRTDPEVWTAEIAEVVTLQAFADQQFVLKVKSPQCAASVAPGSRVRLADARLTVPVMRADATRGTLELLCRAIDPTLESISHQRAGDQIAMSASAHNVFEPAAARPRLLLIGEDDGIAPMIFLAEVIREHTELGWKPLVLLGSHLTLPFRPRPSTILLPAMPAGTIACVPMLDEWGVPSGLASTNGLPGCFDGELVDLAAAWLDAIEPAALDEVEMFAAGSSAFIEAAARTARERALPCQLLRL
jgi:dihydroorotate dehydrogenase electron transfer subunit